MAYGQNQAVSSHVQSDSLGIEVRDEELVSGVDRAELYASNVNRKVERQWKE